MKKISKKEELEKFAEDLKYMIGDKSDMILRTFPNNVHITTILDDEDFDKFVPKEYHNNKELEYNSKNGVRFHLKRRSDYEN
jgi:hypothetical protein